MFGLFSRNNKNICPIDPDMRLWMESAFLWLATQFGHEYVANKQMLLPTPEYFPVNFDGSQQSLNDTAAIVARQMEIDINEVNLEIFQQGVQEFSGGIGNRLWTQIDPDSEVKNASGLYFDKNEDGKYDVFVEKNNLGNPESMIAVLAHEFSHIKLLGEKRLDLNDEYITDLTPAVFGLGIFNANASFAEIKTFDIYGHNTLGYLKQREWGYALALYSYFKAEENPEWIKYLTPNLRSDFHKSMDFMYANQDRIFMEDYNNFGEIQSLD